jgi:ABC-2 type transport system permease protein
MRKILAVETKLMLRDWPSVIISIALPVVLLVALGQIPTLRTPDPTFGGQRFIDAQLPAQMVLLALLTISFTTLPSVLTTYRERGVLRRMSTTPVHPARLLSAQLLIHLAVALVAMVLIIVAGRLVLGSQIPANIFTFVLVILFGTAAMLAMGLVIASIAPNSKSAPGIGSIAMFPLMFVGGMWIPRETMPETLRTVSDYSVVGPFINAMRDTWAGQLPQLPHLIVIAVGLALFSALAVKLFRWE